MKPGGHEAGPQIIIPEPNATPQQVAEICSKIAKAFGPKPEQKIPPRRRLFTLQGLGNAYMIIFGHE